MHDADVYFVKLFDKKPTVWFFKFKKERLNCIQIDHKKPFQASDSTFCFSHDLVFSPCLYRMSGPKPGYFFLFIEENVDLFMAGRTYKGTTACRHDIFKNSDFFPGLHIWRIS